MVIETEPQPTRKIKTLEEDPRVTHILVCSKCGEKVKIKIFKSQKKFYQSLNPLVCSDCAGIFEESLKE